jgi:hypothetical protein
MESQKSSGLVFANSPYCVVVFLLFVVALAVSSICPAKAQSVTWTHKDLGTYQTAGSYTYTSGTPPTFTIEGTSAVEYGGSFVYTPAVGNVEMTARLVSASTTENNSFSGLAMMSSVSGYPTNSYTQQMVLVGVHRNNTGGNYNLAFYWRPGGTTWNFTTGAYVSLPIYMRLARNGNTITGSYSSDGIDWTVLNSYTATGIVPGLYYSSFDVDSYNSPTLNTAVFDHVTYATSVPQQASNLALWLRADAGLTYSGSSVSAWSDQSGNGMNATQTSGTLQPALATGAVNSGVLPTVTFNGSSQYMSTGPDFANLSNGASIFVVTQPTTSTGTRNFCSFGNSGNSDAVFAQAIGTQASLSAYNGTTGSTVTTTSHPLTTSQYQLVEAIYQPGSGGGTGTVYVNGVQQAQATNLVSSLNSITRSDNLIGTGIGLSHYYNGGIAEILVFNATLTTAQRVSIESYILSKYAVGNQPTLDVPTFSPTPGMYPSQQSLNLPQDENAAVFYTLDGSVPSINSSVFTNGVPIIISGNVTVNAIAIAPFFNNSAVVSGYFQINSTTAAIPRNGLQLWLTADNGVVIGGGSQISQWTDNSGAENNATQTNSSYQPTLVNNAINGLPAVQFNGSSQYMQISNSISANFSGGASIFIVTNPTALTSGSRFLDFENCAPGTYTYLYQPSSTSTALYLYNNAINTSVTASNALTTNQFQLLEAIHNGLPSVGIYTNSVLNTYAGSLTPGNNYIGQASASGNYFNGQIAEILVYNRGVTVSEQSQIEGYLYGKYNLFSQNALAMPIISVASSTLSAPTQVALEAPAPSVIHLTTNGTTPTSLSPIYNGPLNIYFTQTVNAIAVLNGQSSGVTSATYTLNSTQWPAPSSTDPTLLQINLQLPTTSVP